MISQERFLQELEVELKEETGINKCYQKYCGLLKLEDIFTTDSIYIAAYNVHQDSWTGMILMRLCNHHGSIP